MHKFLIILTLFIFSCDEEDAVVHGCLDSTACNYTADATIDNNSCKYLDECNECGGDNSTCLDECGVVNGENSTCTDCDGNINPCGDGTSICEEFLVNDECGICNGDNSTCIDCEGVINGTAIEDCNGYCGGTAFVDDCGVCNYPNQGWNIPNGTIWEQYGPNLSCTDCSEIINGSNLLDACGTCDNDSSNDCSCIDYATQQYPDYDPNDMCFLIELFNLNQGLHNYGINMLNDGIIEWTNGRLTKLDLLSSDWTLSANIPYYVIKTIPDNIGSLTELKIFKIKNQLISEIPSSLFDLPHLETIEIAYNTQLSMQFSENICTMSSLSGLSIYNNGDGVNGEIPECIGNLNLTNSLWLQDNGFSGVIPESICNFTGISTNGNQFCPPYPSCISQSHIDSQDTSNCP